MRHLSKFLPAIKRGSETIRQEMLKAMSLVRGHQTKYTYINLFSGIGCWEQGFEGLPLENILCCEIDKHARETFLANFSHLPSVKAGRYHDNVLTLDPKSIHDFDILVASPPCQSFSVAGKRLGLKDERDSKGRCFSVFWTS